MTVLTIIEKIAMAAFDVTFQKVFGFAVPIAFVFSAHDYTSWPAAPSLHLSITVIIALYIFITLNS